MFGDRSAVPVVHEGLEGGRRVAEAKHHNARLVETPTCFERCFVGVGLLNANVVVPLAYIKLGVKSCAAQIANEIANEREGVLVADCITVDGAIVLYGA